MIFVRFCSWCVHTVHMKRKEINKIGLKKVCTAEWRLVSPFPPSNCQRDCGELLTYQSGGKKIISKYREIENSANIEIHIDS